MSIDILMVLSCHLPHGSTALVDTEGINQHLLEVNGENYEGQYPRWTYHNGPRHTSGRLLLLCVSYLDFSVIFNVLEGRDTKEKKPSKLSLGVSLISLLFLKTIFF